MHVLEKETTLLMCRQNPETFHPPWVRPTAVVFLLVFESLKFHTCRRPKRYKPWESRKNGTAGLPG